MVEVQSFGSYILVSNPFSPSCFPYNLLLKSKVIDVNFIYSQIFLYKLHCTPNTLTSFPLVNVPYFSVENFPLSTFAVGVGNYYSVTSSCVIGPNQANSKIYPRFF